MALQRISEAIREILLGISTYTKPTGALAARGGLESDIVERLRQFWGGQLTPPTQTQTRWYLRDLESAEVQADAGNLSQAGKLMLSIKKDGHLIGVLSTRTDGLVRLPKQFKGDPDLTAMLEPGRDGGRSRFDDMFPPSELALLAQDGLFLGIGVAELLPVRGRDYPVLVRLDPQYLQFEWTENRWYYQSNAGLLPITPGDGRWVLHTPGGRVAPWQNGLWRALAESWIRKQHASLHKDNWEAKLANPARVAVAPQGAAEEQKQSVFQQVMAWGVNTVFGLTPGYDVKLIESNGVGWESFTRTIEDSNREYVIAIAGQEVTTTGGAGFQNSDIHKTIRADLIQATADSLAYTLNTQGLPVLVALLYGEAAIMSRPIIVQWDITPPKDRNSEAQALIGFGDAVARLQSGLASASDDRTTLELDALTLAERFNIPIRVTRAAPELALAGAVAGGGGARSLQDTALNGAQITSLLEIVRSAAEGLLPRDSAVAIIQRAFLMSEEEANRLLGSIGQGFVPAPLDSPATPAAPAEAA